MSGVMDTITGGMSAGLGAIRDLFAASGAAGAGTGATSAVPSLLTAGLLRDPNSIAPGMLTDSLKTMGGVSSPTLGDPPSLGTTMLDTASLGLPQSMAAAAPGQFAYDPLGAGVTGSSIGSTMPSDPTINPITGQSMAAQPGVPPWAQAAALGTIGALKGSGGREHFAPAPHMAPANAVPVRLATPITPGQRRSPIDNYLALLKSL